MLDLQVDWLLVRVEVVVTGLAGSLVGCATVALDERGAESRCAVRRALSNYRFIKGPSPPDQLRYYSLRNELLGYRLVIVTIG